MKFSSILLCTMLSLSANAQNPQKSTNSAKPKLVVGIMVDQMRWDYINKFKAHFSSSNGFLRLVNEG
ncbi:MAG: alkaline phosphatase family protein, partial [Sediminibacterium sp.]